MWNLTLYYAQYFQKIDMYLNHEVDKPKRELLLFIRSFKHSQTSSVGEVRKSELLIVAGETACVDLTLRNSI